MNDTIDYYDRNADDFVRATISADIAALRERFLSFLPPNAQILDAGCGAGRDSKAFREKGFRVHALDGSKVLCELASRYIGWSVECKTFDDIDDIDEYDGIWACASLLHVPFEELGGIVENLLRALRRNGVLYMSFKYGNHSETRNGRFFTDMDENRLRTLLGPQKGFLVVESMVTLDVRQGRGSEKWFNVLLKKNDEP